MRPFHLIHHEHPAPERTLLKDNLSMLSLRRGNSWVLYLFLFVGITIQLYSGPASAAKLLDVRVGEYEGFTRVVFEMDTPSVKPEIDIQAPNTIRVAFEQTDADLVRKIPVERSRHIKSLQFWQLNDTLSTVLTVDYTHFRFESFSLSSPPRIAVDIFPKAAPPETAKQESGGLDPMAQSQSDIQPETGTARKRFGQETPEPQQSEQAPVDVLESKESDTTAEKTTPALPKLASSPPQKDKTVSPEPKNAPTKFRLQFFLVIGLVVITIGILFLLLLMLFARHRFSEVKSKLSASEFLQQQDKKIAALDTRIKEQFERYDEA